MNTLNNLQNSVITSSLWDELGSSIPIISNNTNNTGNLAAIKTRDFIYSTITENQNVIVSAAYIDTSVHIRISPKILKSNNSISLNLDYSGANYSDVSVIGGGSLSSSVSSSSVNGNGNLRLQVAASGAIELMFSAQGDSINFVTNFSSLVVNGLAITNNLQSSNLLEKQLTNYPALGDVIISGKLIQNESLTVDNTISDRDGLGDISYQWFKNGTAISNATQSSYKLTQADVDNLISVRANYIDGFGSKESVVSSTTAKIVNVNDTPTGNATISGTATQNQTLTASNTLADTDGLGTISYQWFSDDKVISNATQTTYTLTQSDVGKKITVKASYTDNAGTAESIISATTAAVTNINDAPTGSVKIDGQTKQNQVLAISNTLVDTDGLGTITYQWQSNNKDIANATQVTYKLTQADVGNVITVNANYTDAQGTKESVTSSATAKIENVNDSPTGNVSISGLAAQGQTLASVSTLADIDGMGALKYQWLGNGTAISGATKSTYVLAAADIGKTVSVKVSYTDLLGTAESATSQPTTAIVSTKPSKGNDLLTGKATNDTLSALAGDDTLIGGAGTDKLTGGLGADTFKFNNLSDSGITAKTRDTITDFKSTQNDKIDLSGIDANSVLAGDQAFTFINNATFSADATGQLRFDSKTGILYGSTNADTNAEFSIVLSGVKSLTTGDFVL